MKLTSTGSQTVGPFFSIGLSGLCQQSCAPESAPSGTITITGNLLDGDQKPIPDAVFEFWARGQFVRIATNDDGSFAANLKPPADAHHFEVLIFMRGLLRPVLTRVYFHEAKALSGDACLLHAPQERIATLIARPGKTGGHFVWNVRVQGEDETIFFDF
jgi:protocatechuate 3,4-dioxygenase, alpha subunit